MLPQKRKNRRKNPLFLAPAENPQHALNARELLGLPMMKSLKSSKERENKKVSRFLERIGLLIETATESLSAGKMPYKEIELLSSYYEELPLRIKGSFEGKKNLEIIRLLGEALQRDAALPFLNSYKKFQEWEYYEKWHFEPISTILDNTSEHIKTQNDAIVFLKKVSGYFLATSELIKNK